MDWSFYITHIRFGVATHLAMEIWLGTSFVYHFICKIFPSERNVVFWTSQPVAILAHTKTSMINCTSNNVSYHSDKADDQNANHDAAYDVVRVTRQIVLQS